MKLRDVQCSACAEAWEEMVDNLEITGDVVSVRCPKCGGDRAVIQACAPSVRTPNNSVSFVDGHRDDGGRMSHASATLKAQSAYEMAKYQGKGDVKETYKNMMEHRGKMT